MKNKPVCVTWPMIPVTSTTTASGAASRATGDGANAAARASGVGATASSSADHVAGIGSTLTSAEIVISCAVRRGRLQLILDPP
jgi:hypothetical protein